MSPRSLVFFGLLAVCLAASAQPPAAEKRDPQNVIEPRSKPGAGQEFLMKFVGDWDVAKSFHRRDGGDPVTQKGECKQTMTHDGRFLRSEFTFKGDRGQSTGTGTIGFEADSGRFTSTWIDARSTRFSFRHIKDKFNGTEIVLFGTQLEGSPTPARASKTVTCLEDDGKVIVHRQYGTNADGTERLVMELRMTCKPAK